MIAYLGGSKEQLRSQNREHFFADMSGLTKQLSGYTLYEMEMYLVQNGVDDRLEASEDVVFLCFVFFLIVFDVFA